MADDAQRSIRIKSSLGDDKFLVHDLTVTEPLGQPFVIELALETGDLKLSYKDLLGKHLSVEIDIDENEKRYFDGIVTTLGYTRVSGSKVTFHVTLRPWLFVLTHHVQSKIFQGKTVPNIIKEVFRAADFDAFEDKLQRSDYLSLEYCVQYLESDFAFVSRLMEQEGIYYYFEHKEGEHKMILCDGLSAHSKYKQKFGDMKLSLSESDKDAGTIWDWMISQEIQAGQFTITDYDLEKPNADLKKSKSIAGGHEHDKFEIYEHPGKYTEGNDGSTYVGLRMEEQAAQFEHATGKTRTRWIACGSLFTMKDAVESTPDVEYLVIGTKASFVVDDPEKGSFVTEFQGLETKHVFRSPRRTPKPFIRGPQTAFVVGKSGEEIWTDKYGRVKVQFHWDRDGQNDEKSSCWVRCAQSWAGKNWGGMFIPRIGQEVVVHFLDGDPDRPIITGAVYNANAMPPYGLPDNATQSTFKSNSSKGGGGFNEIRFEDKKGSEEIYVHAEKDMNTEVTHDRSVTVKEGKDTTEVQGDTSLTVKVGNYNIKVSTGSASMTVTQDITIKSNLSITLQVANNSIVIDNTGITIKGTMVQVQGQALTDIKGLMTNVTASAILTAKGSITMIG